MRFQSQKEQLTQNTIEAENIRIEIGSGANEIKNRPVFPKWIEKELFFPKHLRHRCVLTGKKYAHSGHSEAGDGIKNYKTDTANLIQF